MGKVAAAVSAALLLASNAAALDPIVMKGSKFFYENGTQFYMKGIAYQQDTAAAGGESKTGDYNDPLADETACKRDVPIMVKAGTNTIRTYAIDPKNNHDACMKLLSDAGIYVVSDLGEPKLSINRDNAQWNTELLDRYTAVIDALAKYDNTIGFFAGNEVSNNKTNTEASAFVKAAVRDSKKHIKDKGYRWMGVGYAANDDADIRTNSAHYFNCGDQETAIDFWGYNIYSWCGKNTLAGAGYTTQIDFFKNYSVPVFFAEYGCNIPDGADGRIFQETTALYEKEMTDVFSGGIVYMYHQEANDYGLVEINNGVAKTMKNYDQLASRVLAATPAAVQMASYSPTNKAAECPGTSSTWEVHGDALPPTPDSSLCECMVKSLSCTPKDGLKASAIGEIFGYICGASPDSCRGINTNTTTGVYGAYSMCTDEQKLAFVMDTYYKAQKSASTACNYDGQGQVVTPSSTDSSCSSALASASAANSAAATATAPVSSTANPSSSSSGNAAAGSPYQPMFNFGGFAIGAYIVAAGAVGAAMVAL
ncbi:glycolipid anchored surface protein [Colletotrichum abscissum]|uniref:1,3-beta-glucanosyltransferase n=4 Tax=Colletotrichum acutatum species complex TaxID=2707335 RepID=A0A9Q0B0A4_9PEZI|nr:glycolipid anchored surface protein [Colletotrichum lupini]XP_060312498.1 glycolipid anchored surface protein [Colletotrichum costaricense]XP_060375426.1 glycolipid anchored surface protein [Colletotrichum tamarilloi]XP_060401167.1 glycolipid anchored surface protein [Colletotrichum abscissum]KAI3536788.1 glycolipid anchored surface protein [Colletotrichum abscissum]KAK1481530.1 glycolipid anchored surface protein [Colletotrichum tamarilloi]KAK1505240.1 glycolipid anchored surface protein 